MPVLTLLRRAMDEHPTIGDLYLDGEHVCATLELPWDKNKSEISCIPCGTYDVQPLENHQTTSGVTFYYCFRILNVKGRDGILIHPGNTVMQTHGCILIGDRVIPTYTTLLHTKDAVFKLWKLVDGKPFKLEIR